MTHTATTYQIVIVENKKVPTSMDTAAKDAMIIVVPIYQGRLRPQQYFLVIRHMTLDTQLRWTVGFVLICARNIVNIAIAIDGDIAVWLLVNM